MQSSCRKYPIPEANALHGLFRSSLSLTAHYTAAPACCLSSQTASVELERPASQLPAEPRPRFHGNPGISDRIGIIHTPSHTTEEAESLN